MSVAARENRVGERERERMKAVDEEEIEEYKTRQSAALYSR